MMMSVGCVALRSAVVAAMAFYTAPSMAQPVGTPLENPAGANPVLANTPANTNEHLFDLMAPLPSSPVEWPTIESTTDSDEPAVGDTDTRYVVEITGLENIGLQTRFRELSRLYKGRNDTSNVAQIRRRTADDIQLLDSLLRSTGYYDATITPLITASDKVQAPTIVSIKVEPGKLFRIDHIEIQAPDNDARKLALDSLGLTTGSALLASSVDTAEADLRARLARLGHPFPEIGEPEIIIDHAASTVIFKQAINPGPRARFGAIRSEGKAIITSRHLQRMVRYKAGDTYNADEIEDIRRALIATNLYGAVNIRPVQSGANADGTVNVDLVVSGEGAPLRTVSGTAGYSTGEGARLTASWQHRNFFPPQGAVTFSGVAAQRQQSIGAELRRRNWLQRDRTLVVSGNILAQQQDAYNANTATLAASVERETNLIWQKKWYYSAGAELTASNEADLSATTGTATAPRKLYYILAAPLSLSYDGSDDLLNPVRGFRINTRLAPEVSFQSGSFAYVKTQIEGSYYLPVASNVSLAGRLHFGTIFGASRRDIAPSRRFYAGGGGSVRGYSYQQVGPRDIDNVPTGGKSITEASIEARIRFGAWGIVPFVDAGQVFSGTVPSFNSLQLGAGIGARYYTSFGPIRIDVATPLNPRSGDSRVAFYVSIGQAF